MRNDEAVRRVRAGRRLRQLRTARGYTQAQLARQAGCSRPHLANIEAGRSAARLAILDSLATHLDCDPREIS